MSTPTLKMEVIRSNVAISRLLDQAITTVQTIQDARARLRGMCPPIDNYSEQLDTLIRTFQLIRQEPELHNAETQEQSELIVTLAKVLLDRLNNLAVRRGVIGPRHPNNIPGRRDQEDTRVEEAINELERARADLKTRICMAPVGLSGTLDSGYVASLNTIDRVDRCVRSVFEEGLTVARWMENRGRTPDCNGQVPLSNQDAHALGVFEKANWIANKSFDHAELFNSDMSDFKLTRTLERNFEKNEAYDRSFTHNGRAKGEELAILMRIRRQNWL